MSNKSKLLEAWNAGLKSIAQNKDRNERLESGVKQIEQEYTFENWYANTEMAGTKKHSHSELSEIADEIIESCSELKKLNKTQIGSAQLFYAMDKYHEKLKLTAY